MGALAGGAAGAWGGHKVHHGFLGTIGGAIAGSLAEDALKKNRKNGHHKHSKNNHNGSNSPFNGGMNSSLGSFFGSKR